MNVVFAIYADDYYREVHLPALDNADFTLVLRAKEFGIRRDIQILLEVVNERWRIKRAPAYQVFCQERMMEMEWLAHGQILNLLTRAEERLVLLVWELPKELAKFQKYRLFHTDLITIGKSCDNDICCTSLEVISHHHAEIQLSHSGGAIRDLSTNGIYLGNRRVKGVQELHFGDMLNLYGLSILYLGEFIAINCLVGQVEINQEHLRPLQRLETAEQTQPMHSAQAVDTTVHISPRVIQTFYEDAETIENIPAKREQDQKPPWISVLPAMTMAIPMVLGYMLMSSMNMGAGIFISIGSAVVGVFWAIINLRYARKEQREYEMLRLRRYEEYLVRCADQIQEKFQHNRQALLDMYPDASTCSRYHAQTQEIWARKPEHSDFLLLRLGLGNLPFQVKITAPGSKFSMVEDELAQRPLKIAKSFETMREVPLSVPLTEHNVIGVLAGGSVELLHTMLAQIAANHSYIDVKIAVLYNGLEEHAEQWSFIRWLPHIWNEERTLRYLATNESETGDILYALTQVLRNRAERLNANTGSNKIKCLPHYILFVEDVAMLDSQMICKYLYENGRALGITTVLFAERYEALPSACDFVVERSQHFHGMYTVQENDNIRQEISFDLVRLEEMQLMAHRMASMRVNEVEYSSDIPNSLTFFEMMHIHRLSELNVLERWRKNRTYESMRALIGQKAGGADCYLNIHEKYHGPHGLVAGTTGAGKSETLQTYILALAANFSPLDVGFFIIDFKGGGMANLFAKLPHMMGQISNLSGNQVHRAMVSIKSENKRRQKLFGDFNVNHIDAYTRLVKNGEATVPVPHLLIIIDEFAELKREEPDFMRELISVTQVGRSLGVHLILATQKPSGTVDDNIWSNTKFKLCLRVANKQDSNDMLHKPDAAYLTQAGRCYLQVGNDEIYELFQSGWSGAIYSPEGDAVQRNAVLLDLQGREALVGSRAKSQKKKSETKAWLTTLVTYVKRAKERISLSLEDAQRDAVECARLAKTTLSLLNEREEQYAENRFNLQRLEDLIRLWPQGVKESEGIADELMARFQSTGKKLPEKLEKTQLEAVVQYLAEMAQSHGFENEQQLWMPILPERLYLKDLDGYQEQAYQNGDWKERGNNFQLSGYIGLVDMPESQMQLPLVIDFAHNGHLAVVGGVTSGKSTFLQTLLYTLISSYSPKELNLYIVDFSSQMLCPFQEDAHVGGIVLEGEDDRINKLFGLLSRMLKERKQKMKGGSFSQYVQLHGYREPAILLCIDGYANFREKTEDRFENNLIELAREAEGYGIYLMISCADFGGAELPNKIADKMRQSICLEMPDRFSYSTVLHVSRCEVMPETNVKGRGLVVLYGAVLEYQTAMACPAENDYERSEWLKKECAHLSRHWSRKQVVAIPEIPQKPLWEQFCTLDEYQKEVAQGDFLPVAYYQEDASLYSVDLRQTFCYLILGQPRTGKSVFLRNLACAAKDTGGKVILIDQEDHGEQKTAEMTGAEYVSNQEELFQMVKRLISLTNERGKKKKRCEQQGMEEEEVYQAMKEFPPVYILIADLPGFLQDIYAPLTGGGSMNPAMENIFARGMLLNVYFFAVLNVEQSTMLWDKQAYQNFVRVPNGILLGGEPGKQSVFPFQNIPFAETKRQMKPGVGYAVDQEESQKLDLIVIPQNRGLIKRDTVDSI